MKSHHDLENIHDNDDTDSIASDGMLETDISDAPSFHLDTTEKLPFVPEFVFGLSCGHGVLNLGHGRMCYAASHFVVILNYENNTQNFLMGHKNAVTAISADADRDIIATGDSGMRESFVFLWKRDQWEEPVASLKPPGKHGTRFLALSHDGKYLITLSEGLRKAVLNLWEISNEQKLKNNEPSAVVELLEEHGRPREVTFCSDCTEFSTITCTRNVLFLNWVSGQWSEFYPEQMSRTVGRFNSSIYISGTARAATITSKGCVLIWAEKSPVAQPLNQKVNVNVVKLEHRSLTTICETDGVLVIGDVRGQVRFYDQTFKTLLLWFNLEEGDGIKSMSFSVDPENSQERQAQLKVPLLYKGSGASFLSVSIENGPLMVDPRCIYDTKNFRKFLMGPQDVNAKGFDSDIQLPIVPRDVILHTRNGRTSLVSIRHMRCVTIHHPVAETTCATTHPSNLPHLIMGDATGELRIFNYYERETLFSTKIWHSSLSSVRVSPDGHTLFVGTIDGTLIFLHPILLNTHSYRGLHHHTDSPILGAVFSNDSQYVAHYDGEGYVSAFRCLDRVKCRWLYLGKRMIHQNPVRALLFGQEDSNAPLYSIGLDSVLVEYDVINSIGDSLLVKRSDRISMDFSAQCLMWCPTSPQISPSLLVSYLEKRTNVIHLSDRSKMVTANGPFLPDPIYSMQNLRTFSTRPHTSEGERVAVFFTKCYLGLIKCPPEGNPYDVVATFGHQVQVNFLAMSGDHKYAFVGGKNDTPVIMYRINLRALEMRSEMSSPGLEPFVSRLDGGKRGWLFQEMIHSFCYAQILHQGVKSKKVREITNRIPMCEVPDLLRAVGVFTAQFSITRIAQEIRWRGLLCTGTPGNSLSFEDFVKLVVAYYPTKNKDLASIKTAFDVIGHAIDENESVMSRDRFISSLTEKGEALSLAELRECFIALLGKQAVLSENETENVFIMDEQMERDNMFSFLPDVSRFTLTEYSVETMDVVHSLQYLLTTSMLETYLVRCLVHGGKFLCA